MKLTVELVPSTSWFSNLRSLLTSAEWDKIRKACYKKANYKCEICDGKGDKHPVECHETWEYDDINKIQKLVSLISLCPNCHEVKHIGLAGIKGRKENAMSHFCKVNKCAMAEAEKYVQEAFVLWNTRSEVEWKLDISALEELKK